MSVGIVNGQTPKQVKKVVNTNAKQFAKEGWTLDGTGTFSHCSGLTSNTIPDGVTSIGYRAFSLCSKLASVYCKPTTPPTLEAAAFSSNATSPQIYVPTASVDAYKAAEGWSSYADAIVGYEF